jgi:hypothetical protein
MPRLNLNLSDVKEEDMASGGRRCFETGEYLFQITESDYRPTKAGDGNVLKLVWDCMEPGRRGKVFEYLTLEHPKDDVVRIARARLKAIAIATGHRNPDMVGASEELHHKPCLLKLRKTKAQPGYGDDDGMENRIDGYDPAPGRSAPRPAASARPARSEEPPPIEDESIPF